MSACSAGVLSRSRCPLASARSISAASRVASAETAPPLSLWLAAFAARGGRVGLAAGCACARFTAPCACVLRTVFAAAALGEDINLIPFFDHFVFAQLELAVRHALAGLHVVLVAVPGTHEVHL